MRSSSWNLRSSATETPAMSTAEIPTPCALNSSPDTATMSEKFSSISSHLEKAMTPMLEHAVKDQVYKSLFKIERYLGRRDPRGLQTIYDSYATETWNTNQNAQVGPTRYLVPPPQPPTEIRRYNFSQKRMEQDQIDLRVVDHIKIPEGIALRSLIVPQPPDILFTDDYPDIPYHEVNQSFQWLDTNESNAEQCSRRAMSRELIKQSLDDWVFLYFRVQKRNWESTVVEEKKNAPDVNMYAEDQVHKWTLKLRFKMLRLAPIKMALNAFLSRMGLESNPNIIFSRDGFYGLMDVGNIYGELNKTPCAMISFNSTPKYLGLKNGDGVFVNSVTGTQRQMMEDVPRQDGPKKKSKEQGEGEGEEGEYEFVEEGAVEEE